MSFSPEPPLPEPSAEDLVDLLTPYLNLARSSIVFPEMPSCFRRLTFGILAFLGTPHALMLTGSFIHIILILMCAACQILLKSLPDRH